MRCVKRPKTLNTEPMKTLELIGKKRFIPRREREKLALKKNLAVTILVIMIVAGIEIYNSLNFNLLPANQLVFPVSPRFSREAPVASAEPEQSEPNAAQSNSVTSTVTIYSTSTSYSYSSQVINKLKVGVYSPDASGNQSRTLAAIDWSAGGPISPGETRDSSKVYFTNEGTVPVILYLSPKNWVFGDSQGNALDQNYSRYFTLTWDYDNSEIAANETRPVTLSLTVSPWIANVVTFSFDLIVTIEYQ